MYHISMTLEIQKQLYTRGASATREIGLRHPFVTVAAFITLALMASSTPTPLYSIYAAQWHFSPLAVTEVYAVYAIGVLVALLLTGGLSDLIGRRPVMVSALLGLVGAEVIFMFAGGLDWLFVARSIQGLATGLLLGATGAALIDLHPRRHGGQAGLVNGIASAAGIGLGALVSSLLVQYASYPEVTPFVVIAVLATVAAWAAWRLPETVATSGRRISLTPRVPRVPRALWRTFGLSALGVLASWSVGGLYLSLGPVDHRAAARDAEPCGRRVVRVRVQRLRRAGAVGAARRGEPPDARRRRRAARRRKRDHRDVRLLADRSTGSFSEALVVGFGFGAAFMGALRTLASTLPPAHRAGGMAAFFVVAYFAISVPAIGAGVAAVHIGLTVGRHVVRRRRRDRRGAGLGRSAGSSSDPRGMTSLARIWSGGPLDRISGMLDDSSSMPDLREINLNDRIGKRVRALRAASGLSLDALAARCGVSRSMISLIERGESSPTAVVLEKLATGLGVPLASLFDAPAAAADEPIARRADQRGLARSGARATCAATSRRAGSASPIQIVEVSLPAGRARGVRDRRARAARPPAGLGARGRDRRHRRRRDASAARRATAWRCVLDRPTTFQQPTREAAARYAVVIVARARDRGDDVSDSTVTPRVAIRRLHRATDEQLAQLADVLIDCVDGGASVGFMHPLSACHARWRSGGASPTACAAGERALFVAEDAHRHRRHGAAPARPAGEPAAPRGPGEDARASAGAAARRRRGAGARGRGSAAAPGATPRATTHRSRAPSGPPPAHGGRSGPGSAGFRRCVRRRLRRSGW